MDLYVQCFNARDPMETKYGIQTLHGKYYLCTRSRCYGAATTKTASVEFSVCLTSTACKLIPFSHKIKRSPVYLCILLNSEYRVLRGLLRGLIFHFQGGEPDSMVRSTPYKGVSPVEELYAETIFVEVVHLFLRCTDT